MKKIGGSSFLLAVVLFGLAAAGQAEPLFVKLGAALPPEHPTSQALTALQQEIGKMRAPQMEMQIFPAAQFGAASEMLAGVEFGGIELGVFSAELLAARSPLLAAIAMPYIFRDEEQRLRVLDGPVGAHILDALKQRNLIGLGFFDAGAQNLLTKKQPVKTPADLQGLKIGRVNACPEPDCRNLLAQLASRTFAAMGATVELLRPEDAAEAFRTGRIDGWEGNALDCKRLQIVDAGAAYFTQTGQSAIPDVLVASKRWFETLSPEAQQALQQAARVTVRRQRELWRNALEKASAECAAAGVTFETPVREPFYNAVQPVYREMEQERRAEFEQLLQTMRAVN